MRTIKFRAWITEAKQMIEHNYIDFNDFLHKTDLLGNINHSYCGDVFILMQFTGLYDKNGKEIYEQMELNNIFIIKWLNFRYVLFYISNLTTFEEIFDYENKLEITREYTEL